MASDAGSQLDIYDPEFVKDVFDRCSGTYILFSYVCSFGFTERWRRQCVDALPGNVHDPICFDLMSGTGEVWPHLERRFQDIQRVEAIDISDGMHKLAMERLHQSRPYVINFTRANLLAEELAEHSAGIVISTFGLKTFDEHQQDKLADTVARILKPGGQFSFIEASDPTGWILRPLYNFYLHKFLPFIERTLLQGATDFAMIGRYTQNFQNISSFSHKLRERGLVAEERRYFFGCASGVSGYKPDE